MVTLSPLKARIKIKKKKRIIFSGLGNYKQIAQAYIRHAKAWRYYILFFLHFVFDNSKTSFIRFPISVFAKIVKIKVFPCDNFKNHVCYTGTSNKNFHYAFLGKNRMHVNCLVYNFCYLI